MRRKIFWFKCQRVSIEGQKIFALFVVRARRYAETGRCERHLCIIYHTRPPPPSTSPQSDKTRGGGPSPPTSRWRLTSRAGDCHRRELQQSVGPSSVPPHKLCTSFTLRLVGRGEYNEPASVNCPLHWSTLLIILTKLTADRSWGV